MVKRVPGRVRGKALGKVLGKARGKLLGDIHQSYFVVALAVGVIAGIILALVFRINFFSSFVWIIFVVVLFIIAYLKPKFVFVIAMLIGGMILAFFRVSSELTGQNYIQQFYGDVIEVSGVIEGDPETDEAGTKFHLKNLRFGKGCQRLEPQADGCEEASGGLYVNGTKNEDLKRGDQVGLSGKLSEGFGVYIGYLYKPRVVWWERPEPGDLTIKLRDWFAGRVLGLISDTEAKLGLSYLLGMRSGLPDDLDEKLRVVGLVHIVVASGAHLSILVGIMRKIFGGVSRFAQLLFSLLFISFFMTMIGFTPSILRAGIMSILALLAWYVGRKFAPWRIILIVAAFTLILNPMFTINLGWLLSFASYGGIMILGPRMVKFFYGAKKPGFIASIIITTIAATLMTLPVILYFYGQVSLISLFANLLILPTLPYAMGLVFLTGVFAGLPGIETTVAWIATRLLSFHIEVVGWLGEMEYFLVKISPYQVWVFGIYAVIFLLLLVARLRKWTKSLKNGKIKGN